MSRGKQRFKTDQHFIGTQTRDDRYIFHHAQDIDPVLAEAQRIRMGNDSNGFTDDRTLRHIGHIPASAIMANPALREAQYGDPEIFAKMCQLYLRTEEGKRFQTVTKGV